MKRVRILLLYFVAQHNQSMSYQLGWAKHFQLHPRFKCHPVNLGDKRKTAWLRSLARIKFGSFDAVVLLHSVFSNSCKLAGRMFDEVHVLPQPKAYFIGNEYKLMPEKMAFCESLGLNLLITMNPDPRAQALYRDRLDCAVECIPSAGLDTDLFRPRKDRRDRPIDLGYRASRASLYLGNDERYQLAEYFLTHAPKYELKLDISIDEDKRLSIKAWADFLNECKGQIGSEAGGDYFEMTDKTRKKVNKYVNQHPDTTIEEIKELFFKNYLDSVPTRMISGRQTEAAGTKTLQILFEGRYSGYFEPDVHYIPLKKDFSNFEEVMVKFDDEELCNQLTENAYDVTMQELTYEKLIERFYRQLTTVI